MIEHARERASDFAGSRMPEVDRARFEAVKLEARTLGAAHAAEGVAMRCALTGRSAAEIVAAMGVADPDAADIERRLAEVKRERVEQKAAKMRTAATVADLVATGEFPNLARAFAVDR